MTSTPRRFRRLWPALAAALVVNAAAGYALADASATRSDLAADQKSVTWQDPTPQASPTTAPAPAAPTTPAGQVLQALAATPVNQLLGEGIAALSAAPAGTSLRPECWDPATESAAVTLVGSGPGGGVSLQLIATPAGAGTATVAGWQQQARSCGATAVVTSSRDVHPDPAAAGFTVAYTAPTPAGSAKVSPLAQVVWSRGDVVVLLTYGTGNETTKGVAYNDLASLTSVVNALDASLVAALSPVCTDLAPTEADVVRNPALPGYTGYQRTEQVAVPAAPVVTKPQAPAKAAALPLPEAAPVEALAPVADATEDDWEDTDNDGDPDTLTPVAKAPRGQAPVLVDPTKFTATSTQVTDPGAAPARPAAPAATVSYQVTMDDPQGPGCGWAFTGQSAPEADVATLEADAKAAREKAIADAGSVRATAWAGQLAWARQWQAWAAKDAAYAPVREYEQARQDATTAWQDAAAVYQASVDAWQTAAATPPTAADPETPSSDPTSKPNPSTPTPAPSPAPTNRPGSSS